MASPTFPFTQGADNAAEKAYRAAVARYNPTAPINNAAALTWSSAKMLERAVELLGPSARDIPLTRELIIKGLGMVKNETLGGLIPSTSYKPGPVQGHREHVLRRGGLRPARLLRPAGVEVRLHLTPPCRGSAASGGASAAGAGRRDRQVRRGSRTMAAASSAGTPRVRNELSA